jgi:hypothetical protein
VTAVPAPPADGPREAILDRLRQVIDLSYRLSRDDLDTSIEPITDPERDLWSAAALLHSALHRHGIAVRDEYWEILAGAVAVPAETCDEDCEIEPYPDPDCPNCTMDHGSLSEDPDWYHASDCPRLGTDAQFGPPWPPFEGPAMTEGTS